MVRQDVRREAAPGESRLRVRAGPAARAVALNFTPSPTPTVGTTGRALDHIGFEIKNLEAFTKKLEADGIKLDRPYTKVAALGIAIAFIKDPVGHEHRDDRGAGYVQVEVRG